MKIAYIVTMSISLVFFALYIIFYSKKVRTRIQKCMLGLHITAFFIILANLCIALSGSAKMAEMAHGLYFISMDWLLYAMLLTCVEYTLQGNIRHYIWAKVLILADTINIILNYWLGHNFYITEFEKDGVIYYKFGQNAFYHVHLTVCYFLVAMFMGILIYKCIKVPLIYGTRYLFLIGATIIVVSVDGVYLLSNQPLDWSAGSYAVFSIVGSWIIRDLVPRGLLHRTQSVVVNELTTGLIIFDREEHCLFTNKFIREYFNQSQEEMLGDHGILYYWKKKHDLTINQDIEFADTFTIGKEKKYYRLSLKRYFDRKNKYIGSYILIQDTTEENKHAEMDHLRATRDELTGLYNRRYFFEQAELILKKNGYKDYILICSDITNFKMYNEIYGTEKGDEILKIFAKFIIENCEGKDILYGNFGGDDFAMLLPKALYTEEKFVKLADDIMAPVNRNKQLHFVCRMGVYEVVEEMSISAMCDRAMLVISQIKEEYKKTLGYYDESLKNQLLLEQEMNSKLDEAIKNEEIRIFIQPQVDDAGKTLGGECLVRWITPDKGMLSPITFIPTFEKNGRIADLDKHVWKLACKKLKEWKNIGRTDLYLSVNISPRDIILLDVYKELTELVERYQIDPKLLKLEITESFVMNDIKSVKELVSNLQNYGFIVEMDDFGSGYSSLNVLKDMTVNVVKIDMKFLDRTDNTERSKVILKNVAELLRVLGMDIVVEGVETDKQLEFLKTIGCEVFQGYYFAKPLPVDEFEARVAIGSR